MSPKIPYILYGLSIITLIIGIIIYFANLGNFHEIAQILWYTAGMFALLGYITYYSSLVKSSYSKHYIIISSIIVIVGFLISVGSIIYISEHGKSVLVSINKEERTANINYLFKHNVLEIVNILHYGVILCVILFVLYSLYYKWKYGKDR